jgi:hypothetical protein
MAIWYVHFMTIWYILWLFGTFDGHLAHLWPFGTFMAIWYILWPFGKLFSNLVYFPEKSGNPDDDSFESLPSAKKKAFCIPSGAGELCIKLSLNGDLGVIGHVCVGEPRRVARLLFLAQLTKTGKNIPNYGEIYTK